MLSNEQRAHDLACAVISNQTLLSKMSNEIYTKDDTKRSIYVVYKEAYDSFLDGLNKSS